MLRYRKCGDIENVKQSKMLRYRKWNDNENVTISKQINIKKKYNSKSPI